MIDGTPDALVRRFRAAGSPVIRRFRLLGWAFGTVMLGTCGLGLLAVTLLGMPLLVAFPVGAAVILGAVRLIRRFANVYRWIIGSTLHDGERAGYGTASLRPAGVRQVILDGVGRGNGETPSPYPPWPSGSRWRQLLALARQPATWRDVAWLLVNGTVGVVAAAVVAGLFVGAIYYLSLPLQYALLRAEQAGVAGEPASYPLWGFWEVQSGAVVFVGIPLGLACLAMWWWLTPHLLGGYAKLSRRLLGSTATTALTRAMHRLLALRANTVSGEELGLTDRRAKLDALTQREREVLALLAEGRTNAAIAARLFITEKAVDKHINSVFRKLDLTMSTDDNRRVLAALAYRGD